MKTRIPHAGLFGVLIATPVLMCLALFVLASTLSAQTGGQNSISRKKPFTGSTGSSSGSVLEHFTIANGQLVGRTSAGVLSGLTIGSGLSLSGTTLTATAPTVAIGDVTGLQTALDGKASLSGTYANPSWITSLPFSKLTGLPNTLAGHGITSFETNAFILTDVEDSLGALQRGLGRVDGRDTAQLGGGTLQWYQSGADKIMAWSGKLQAESMDLTHVSIFTAVPATSTSAGEVGQMAHDEAYFYICVALNTWKRFALSSY